MAVYQGARQRTIVLPRRPRVELSAPTAPTLPRRRVRSAVRFNAGSALAANASAGLAFAGAFFSLSQDIRVSATGYEMDRLVIDQQRLQAQADDLRNELNRLGKAPAIRKFAIDAGLGPLPEPEIIAAR